MEDKIISEILRLYVEERLTQAQIAYRLDIPQRTISDQIKKARKNPDKFGSAKKTYALSKDLKDLRLSSKGHLWRFHSLEFTITPFYLFPRYERIRKERGGWFVHKDWQVKLNEKTISMKLRRGFDFVSEDKLESIGLAEASLTRSLYYLSNQFGFEYQKEGRIAIRLDKQHLANTNSPLAKARKGQYLQVKGIDGKVWLLVDWSPGSQGEHEFIHSGRFLEDSRIITEFFQDLRENPEFKPSFLGHLLMANTKQMGEFGEQLKLHLEVLDRIGKGIDELVLVVGKLKKKP